MGSSTYLCNKNQQNCICLSKSFFPSPVTKKIKVQLNEFKYYFYIVTFHRSLMKSSFLKNDQNFQIPKLYLSEITRMLAEGSSSKACSTESSTPTLSCLLFNLYSQKVKLAVFLFAKHLQVCQMYCDGVIVDLVAVGHKFYSLYNLLCRSPEHSQHINSQKQPYPQLHL